MRKLRTALTAVATASMVLGTMGAAMADQSTGQWETRADFIFQLDKTLNIQPVYPATPDFQDVSTSDPYYGYVEAAYQAGITNGITQGVFGPSLALTRAEAAKYLVIAFGAGAAAQNITSTSFGDNANIPSALVGYVGEAAALGLMKGFPDGNFHPDSNLTTTQEGYLISQLTTSMSSLKLTVSASASDVAAGQLVTLSTSGTTASGTTVASPLVTYSVTGTNAADALVSGNTFVASAPGSYTVEATSGTSTGTATIAVYGTPAALKISAPTSLVQNGQSTGTVTVSVVDANGNVVANNTDNITLNDGTGVVGTVATSPEAAVNGVATFTLTAGTVAGASETLNATDGDLTDATATLTGAAQVPTSVSVSASGQYMEANDGYGSDGLSAVVDDQTGNPMLSGAYTISFSLSGPATFSGSSTAAGVYYGPNGTAGAAKATLSDVQGSTGAITVTASATGLTSSTASVTAVISGGPAAITTTPSATTFAEGAATGDQSAAGHNVTVSTGLVDSHGYPVAGYSAVPTGEITVSVSSGGAASANLDYSTNDGATWTNINGSASFTPAANGTFLLADSQSAADAGTYSVTVSDSTDGVSAAAPFTLTETAGPAKGVSITSPANSVNVPASAPDATFSAQVVDAFGNPVADGGDTMTFYATSNDYGFTLGGVASSSNAATYTATTAADGSATASLAIQPYTGNAVTVIASAAGNSSTGVTATVQNTVATTLSASLQDTQTGSPDKGSNGYAVAGDTVTVKLTAADQYGNSAGIGDTFSVTTGPGLVAQVGNPSQFTNGVATLKYTASQAGPVTLSATDTELTGTVTGSSSMNVTAGPVAGFDFFDASGNNVSLNADSFTAGTEVALSIMPVDSQGNPTIAPVSYDVFIDGSQGEYRLTASGSDFCNPALYTAGNCSVFTFGAGLASATVYFTPSSTGSFTIAPEFGVYVGPFVDVTGQSYSSTVAVSATPGADTNWSLGTVTGSGSWSFASASPVTTENGFGGETIYFTSAATASSGVLTVTDTSTGDSITEPFTW